MKKFAILQKAATNQKVTQQKNKAIFRKNKKYCSTQKNLQA